MDYNLYKESKFILNKIVQSIVDNKKYTDPKKKKIYIYTDIALTQYSLLKEKYDTFNIPHSKFII